HPVALPSPHDRLATHLSAADPVKWPALGGGVGIVLVVHEELGGALVAGVALALDGLPLGELPLVAQVAIVELVRRGIHQVVAGRVKRAALLQHQHPEALSREFLRGPPATDARADHDGIPLLASAHRATSAMTAQPSNRPGKRLTCSSS